MLYNMVLQSFVYLSILHYEFVQELVKLPYRDFKIPGPLAVSLNDNT